MKYLILGNGIAGISAAISVREHDVTGEISVVTKSPMPFYYRIRLIEYLAKKTPIEKLIAYGDAYYDDKEIKVTLNKEAVRIDSENKKVEFEDGSVMTYDRLLLATGARPRYPNIEGMDKKGILKFRGASDSDEIIRHIEICDRVVVLGGGILGIEAANSLVNSGKDVTVIESADRLLHRQLDREGSDILQKTLEEKNIKFILGKTIKKVLGDKSVKGIEFEDGTIFDTGCVVLSAGIIPRLELCESGGIEFNKGIIVDEHMETNVKGIFAAGDAAEYKGTLYGLWAPSKEQGEVAGGNMTGIKIRNYNPTMPEVRLKVTGISLFSGGNIDENGAVVYRYNKNGIYRKFFVRDNRIVGAILIGDMKTSMRAGHFIRSKEGPEALDGLYE
ncbi:NAD(P)/FAD-dependent oxidoreductase [Psychrilyobacter atlanticus]|uniref:NAD(P)/FAD-dependent oxidoreductase n=1 Tax=Psychrilyobacter atlanticus TaxID=271091 RepID=UPI0004091807|nr:FAD-dependent oxidoreductase [Psychrilyobacter atlanticus]